MDADKLRYIARSLDILTGFVRPILEADLVLVDDKPITQADRDMLLEWVNGTAQQDDLRRWADALEAQPAGSGGPVEADVEGWVKKIRQAFSTDFNWRFRVDDARQALTNLTAALAERQDRIGELRAAVGEAEQAAQRWGEYDVDVSLAENVRAMQDSLSARIHYLEGRVGALERENAGLREHDVLGRYHPSPSKQGDSE